jgi:hypothetical protein
MSSFSMKSLERESHLHRLSVNHSLRPERVSVVEDPGVGAPGEIAEDEAPALDYNLRSWVS